MSRKTLKITEKHLADIERFASRGLNKEQISLNLGWSKSAFYDRQSKSPEILEACERGRAAGVHELTNGLFDSALGGNVVASIFMLKNLAPDQFNDRKYAEAPIKLVDLERYSEEEIQQIALNGLKQMLNYEKRKGLPTRAQQLILEYEEGLKK